VEKKRVSFYEENLISSVVPDQIKCARAESIIPADVLVQERFRVSHRGVPRKAEILGVTGASGYRK
jgi:hypothetical protein